LKKGDTNFYKVCGGSLAAAILEELCSTRHALGINIWAEFYADAARLDLQEKRRITL
jgi:hypothetical protein